VSTHLVKTEEIFMPMPVPADDENRDDFVSRCMSDDVMRREYPAERQRYAVCLTQWTKGDENVDDTNDE
jgi:hypothetical protein